MASFRVRTIVAALTTLASTHALARDRTVSITLTEHGIPHIQASDYRGLGYGYGYAMAQNDLCGMASMFATYSGERAVLYGEDQADINYLLGRRPINNAASDFAMRLMIDAKTLARADRDLPPQMRELLSGYAAGFNRYLAAHEPESGACRAAARPITVDDIQRRIAGLSMLLSSGLVLQQLYDAAPPGDPPTTQVPTAAPEPSLAGSNAYAFGKDTTENHTGLLLGNPHFFWDGPNRFVEVHLTIPGEYDVMGIVLQGIPLVVVGFNHSMAWTHTVSTDERGVLYRLSLDPNDPTHYRVDDRSVAMTRQRVTIDVRTPSGKIEPRTHDFWMTAFGPVLSGPGMQWTREHAYALTDTNQSNDRTLRQWWEIGRSADVAALQRTLHHTMGLPWVNTIATDSKGSAFYADLSTAPNFNAARIRDCSVKDPSGMSRFFAVLDGSRSSCSAPIRKTLPRPCLTRTDFVANSNGSHWLTNAVSPLEGFSPVIGPERVPQSLRTRQGQIQVSDRLAGRDGLPGSRMSPAALERILFSGRSLQAELVLDNLLTACQQQAATDVQRGCAALAKWDRHYTLDSRGAHLFSEFVDQLKRPGSEDLGTTAQAWRIHFDSADPVHTPSDFNADDLGVFAALAKAVAKLDQASIPLDAKLGDVQFVVRAGDRIPLPGGSTYSALHATLVPKVGYTDPIQPSNSYIQVVTFDAAGPVADAILASSQSPEPQSPFYADQTWAYSRAQWIRLPFSREAIAAAAIAPTVLLRVPAR
ncbi:MAG: penicillin acylase family protein [Proteobacteria bacterium]|nr:penicillin acylase family protein [Pseudomonadota bacterium]